MTTGRWWAIRHANGSVVWRWSDDGRELVRVWDETLKCACFIGYMDGDQKKVTGTAFFMSLREGRLLAVTAKHVVTATAFHSGGRPICLWLNHPTGIVRVDTREDEWLFHPTDEAVDVAVLKRPINGLETDHLGIFIDMLPNEEFFETHRPGIGDDLYFPGLFLPHQGTDRVRPILRFGTIAAVPAEPIRTDLGLMDAYLAEVRSIGGLSGSPVILRMGLWRDGRKSVSDPVPEVHSDVFFGMVHGHYERSSPDQADAETLNMGISIIIPVRKIMEVLDQPEVAELRKPKPSPSDGVPVMDAAVPSEPEEWGTFKDLASKLAKVPKSELDARRAETE